MARGTLAGAAWRWDDTQLVISLKANGKEYLMDSVGRIERYLSDKFECAVNIRIVTGQALEGKELFHGFSCGDWQSDIMQLIKKIKYNEQLKNLEEKSKALESYYSKEKQDDIAVQNLLKSLGL